MSTTIKPSMKTFPVFDVKEALALYEQKRFDALCQRIFDVIKHCHENYYAAFSINDQKIIDDYVGFTLFVMTREDFRLPENFIPVFINANHIFSNLVAISSYENTDAALKTVLKQSGNYAKILFLYTCRNTIEIPFNDLITPNPQLATLWWNNFSVAPPGSTNEHVYNMMVKHLTEFPDNLRSPDFRTQPIYFQSSYLGVDERPIKQWYNTQVRSIAKRVPIVNRPRKNWIAIVTDKWIKTTAVYKSSYPQIAALAKKFDLTLICSNKAHMDQVDRSLFKKVVQVQVDLDKVDLSAINPSFFSLAYFPDIGMTDDSVFLSNVKLAPIMVCGYGHPVSTYGSLVDYFIGGKDSECMDLWENNYTERLVLIPGLGAHPVDPCYERKNPDRSDDLRINCCWTTPKINWPMLKMLQNAQKASERPVHFQFFPSWTATRYNNYPITCRELASIFGTHVSIFPNLSYHEYLSRMEQATLTVDSYPFGGYNTIVDSLFVGCPVVTIEGTKFYNRASTALARRVGIDFSSKSISECGENLIRLLRNPSLIEAAREKLADVDRLKSLLLHTDEPQYFVKAIEYILQNHPVPGKEPIVIQ